MLFLEEQHRPDTRVLGTQCHQPNLTGGKYEETSHCAKEVIPHMVIEFPSVFRCHWAMLLFLTFEN